MSKPIVREVKLEKSYRFQYENFVLATQSEVIIFLEKEGGLVNALRFDGASLQYGPPNDEARGGHPLSKHGLGFYGLFWVENSPRILEIMKANRVHPQHSDAMFANQKHYIACFKDVTVEVVCRAFEEISLAEPEVVALLQQQLDYLE